MLQLATFCNRASLPIYLNVRGLVGQAVEVGTHRGVYAARFLSRWKGSTLYCIDPWQSGYCEGDPASDGDREADYRQAVASVAPFGSRCVIIRQESVTASRLFRDQQLDFVYIDGNHDPTYFREDLRVWWPKVRNGGILAGHDFLCINEQNGGWARGIQAELLPFAEGLGRDVFMIIEDNNGPWSFFLVK